MIRSVRGWLAVGLQAVLLLLLLVLPGRRPWSALWPPDIAALAGVLLILAAIALFVSAARTLSTALTPTPVPLAGETLRTGGVYRWVRHPIYSAVLMAAVGYSIAVGSWWQVGVCALLAVFFVFKARWEDTMLREAHGTAWSAYRSRTGALLPKPSPKPPNGS